jgi:hypothetical protein
MFDSFYKFRYCNHINIKKGQYNVREHILTFSCKKNNQYIVHVEEYPHFIYVIKFHLKSHRLSEKKYNLQTNLHDPLTVIGTCVEIMLYFYKLNPFASFAFIGANSLGEGSIKNTRRFKVYRRIMENAFSPFTFNHLIYENESAYVLLNKDNIEDNLFEKVEEIFNDCYLIDKNED